LLLLTGNGLKDVEAVLRTTDIPNCYPPTLEGFMDQLKKNDFDLSTSSQKQVASLP